MMPTQYPQGIHISGDGLALDGDQNEPCSRRVPATSAGSSTETAARVLLQVSAAA